MWASVGTQHVFGESAHRGGLGSVVFDCFPAVWACCVVAADESVCLRPLAACRLGCSAVGEYEIAEQGVRCVLDCHVQRSSPMFDSRVSALRSIALACDSFFSRATYLTSAASASF
ncbi:hypothetical protein [Mycobacterium intracellulare]|uniref:hypothetical protein n=1 Tax=Mycobacterium intracellulare TaxID=1767 RepID=UPI0011AB4304|nr:hypothetical protein [Mycobacterium intracellulare]UCN12841.1 hypothetical protein LFT50_28360 [Mycobacterium intracellulare subsp. chimaera]